MVATGGPYPLALAHPLKVLGNAFAVLLVAGSGYFVWRRLADHRGGLRSNCFDWLLPLALLACGLTGVATELLRVWGLPSAAYPAYFAHLVTVLVLLVLSPYTKMAHATYRTVAMVQRTARSRTMRRRPDHPPAPEADGVNAQKCRVSLTTVTP